MSEGDHQRELSNQTATFNHLHRAAPSPLSSIPEEPPEATQIATSVTMPQPLIKSRTSQPNQLEFAAKQQKREGEGRQGHVAVGPNVTFYPRMAEQLLYQDTAIDDLRMQQANLKGELSGLSEMISDLIDKKNGVLNEYEQVVREKRAYKRLRKNLEQEYQSYLFMLDGDYCQRLDEESERMRQLLVEIRHEVHAMNTELSRPVGDKRTEKEVQRSEQVEKQFYEKQMELEKLQSSNQRKQERLALLLAKNAEKQKDLRQIGKKMDQIEYDCELDEVQDPEELKKNGEKYEELSKKAGKLRKIRDNNQKVKEADYSRKVKKGRQQEAANTALDTKIIEANEKLYKVLIELQATQQNPKAATLKEDQAPPPSLPKRSTSAFKEPQLVVNEKHKLTLQADTPVWPIGKSSKSLARVQTEPVESFDDRQELQMRQKKIYTELQRNLYFKNIENREEERMSRIQEFNDKQDIAISSYDRFAHPLPHPTRHLKLPEIQPRLATQGNESIIYAYESVPHQRRLNKRSIELQNRQRQLRASKYHPNSSNYRQLCSLLNRDRLLIEEDCEYEMGQLIYHGHS